MISRYTALMGLSLCVVAAPVGAQTGWATEVTMLAPMPSPVSVCEARETEQKRALTAILEASALERQQARERFRAVADSLAEEAAAVPDDVELQFMLAVVIGSLADVESGRARVQTATALHAQVQAVLALDPGHAGAHHLLGRLHAAVMRMDRLTRFLATRVLGGSGLRGASWSEAQRLLEAAAVEDPCTMDHHFELAKLYAERGADALAQSQLRQLLNLRASGARDGLIRRRAIELLAALSTDD